MSQRTGFHSGGDLGNNLLNDALGFELLIDGVEVAALLEDPVDADVRHLFRLAGNNPLPAHQAHADELNRVKGHLDGKPVGQPTNNGRHEWHRQKRNVVQV